MGGEVGKDLTAGTVAGVAQLLIGHPFDTVKVKLQSQPAPSSGRPRKYNGAIDAVKKILASDGPRGLYKGLGAPLATVALFNAVLFTARGQMEAMLLHDKPGSKLSVRQQMVAGAGAGVAVSFVACPTELVKCRLQAQSDLEPTANTPAPVTMNGAEGMGMLSLLPTAHHSSSVDPPASAVPSPIVETLMAELGEKLQPAPPLHTAPAQTDFTTTVGIPVHGAAAPVQQQGGAGPYNGSMDVARQVFRCEGGWAGFFKGIAPTLLREVFGNAAYFGAYEGTKRLIARGQDTAVLGMGSQLLAGGVAGAMFWLSVYPADVIKSVMQVDSYRNPKYKGTMDAFRKVFAAEGVRGLYRGFGPAMARSVPANAVCFLAYALVRKRLA